MRKLLILIIFLPSVAVLSLVPVTADFALILNDLGKVHDLLPEVARMEKPSAGFVCFFGKLTLNLPTIFQIIESEKLKEAQNIIDLSVVTNDPEWVKTNLQQIVQDKTFIQHEDVFYFVSDIMMEDVKAMTQGKLAKLELDKTVLIHGKLRTVPILGMLLHLLGFSEGIPIEDEFTLNIDQDEIVKMVITSKKVCKSDWELEQLAKKAAPRGLKVLPKADLVLLLPTSLSRQIPAELMEEFDLDLGELSSVIFRSNFIALSVFQEDSKLSISFDVEKNFIEELLKQFEEMNVNVQQTNDWIVIGFEEFTLKVPSKGGIAFLLSNVEERDLIEIETNLLAKLSFSQEELFVDVSMSRDGCSLIIDAKISSVLLKELLSDILADLLPLPEEIETLQKIIEAIDDAHYYENANPPENLEQLQSLLEEKLPGNVLYTCEEDDGTFIVRVGVKTELANRLDEDWIYKMIEIDVDEIEIDRKNQIIYFIKSYEKYELPSISEIVRDLVEGFRMYYADFGELPDDLKTVRVWYTWLPSSTDEIVSFTAKAEERKVILKIKSDEELEEDLIEELSLEEILYENGNIIVAFKVE